MLGVYGMMAHRAEVGPLRLAQRTASRTVQLLLVPPVLDRDGMQSARHYGWDLGFRVKGKGLMV